MGKNERQAYLKAIRSRYRRARKKARELNGYSYQVLSQIAAQSGPS
jgi:hypothetical protein